MPCGDAPLQLAVQPGIGPAAFEAAQDAAADEDAQGHAQDDERWRDGDRAEHPRQWRADQQAGSARQAAADPQLVGGKTAHDNGMAVEPVRKERHGPVRTDVLLLGHASLAYRMPVASVSSQMPITSRTAPMATVRPNWPRLAASVDFSVGPVGVVAHADEHRGHHQQGHEHDDVVAVVADRFHDAVARSAGRVLQLRQTLCQ